jgi:hypothetical protein
MCPVRSVTYVSSRSHTNKYAAILTFSLPDAVSEKAICQKFAKSSSRLTLPSIRVGEYGLRLSKLLYNSGYRYHR